MPFTLLVCGDLFSEKVNLELQFPDRPTLPELQNHVQNVFTQEMKSAPLSHQPGTPMPDFFNVNKIQIYDDVLLKWADLSTPQQLHEYDQLYCFQPTSPWQTDVQKDLPAPRPPTMPVPSPVNPPAGHMMQPSIGYAPQSQGQIMMGNPAAAQPLPVANTPHYSNNSNTYAQAATVTGLPQPTGMSAVAQERPNVPLEERIRVSFAEIDEMSKGWVDASELERAFRNRGIDFSANTVGELFIKADQPREGRIDLNKWHIFAQVYPNTVDAVYYRGRDIRDEQVLRDGIAATQAELDAGRAKEQELRGAADAQAQHNQRLMQSLQDQEAKLRSAAERRNLLESQERALIEQEV